MSTLRKILHWLQLKFRPGESDYTEHPDIKKIEKHNSYNQGMPHHDLKNYQYQEKVKANKKRNQHYRAGPWQQK